MLSRWRSKCFFNRPSKHVHALVYGGWFDVESACPLLEGHCFVVVRKHYYVAMSTWMNRRCRKSLFNRPPRFKSMLQGFLGYSYSLRPLFHARRFAFVGEQFVVAFVLLLLLASAPLAVIRSISSIVVNSVNRMLRAWLRSHVFQEVEERLLPPFANSNSSSTISVIASGIWIAASRLHHLPRLVLGRLLASMPSCFRLFDKGIKIASSHLKLLHSFMVVRAESVHHDCLGSFHCAMLHKVVQ